MADNLEREENLEPQGQTPEGTHYPEDHDTGELDPKMKKGIIAVSVIVVLVFLSVLGYQYLQEQDQIQVVDASTRLVRVQQLVAEGNMDAALTGAPDIMRGGEPIMGFSEIAEYYSDQEAGKTAALNAGKIYLDRGDTDNALKMFNIAEESDVMLTIIGATAGKAATLEERGDHDKAAELYLKASKLSQATNIKQKYLYYAGLNSSVAGEGDKAGTMLNEAIKLSPAAQWANMARAELGRLGMKIAY